MRTDPFCSMYFVSKSKSTGNNNNNMLNIAFGYCMMAASWTQDGPKMAQDGHHTASEADVEHMLGKIT